jgi:hypothetical protein
MMPECLGFHTLTFVDERDDVLVGRPDTDSYALFPRDGAALLRRLRDGADPAEAALWYQRSYGDPIDMENFVTTLQSLGFLRDAEESAVHAGGRAVRFQRLGRALFSPAAACCYVLALVACAVTMARYPALRPGPHQIFFSKSLVLVQLLLCAGQFVGVLWHEAFHILAGRRLGVASRMRLGRRLYFIVAETNLTGLLSLPRQKRYLPYLAGMLADVVLFSCLTLAAAASRGTQGNLPFAGRLALALAFTTLMRLAWQLYVFLRTDLYYVASTALGCSDLDGAARAYLRKRIRHLLRLPDRPADDEAWSPRDLAVARPYAWFAALGVTLLLGVVVVSVVPAMAEAVARVSRGLGSHSGPRFWDAAVVAALGLAQVVLLLALWLRSRAGHRNPQRDVSPVRSNPKEDHA